MKRWKFISRFGWRKFIFGLVALCIIGICLIHFGKVELLTLLTRNDTMDGTPVSVGTIRYSAEAYEKVVCNIIREDMDLMKMKKLPLIKQFKNPCWYENGTLQCMPYMFLIGAAKCGSADTYRRLGFHPDFIKPTFKENNWLSYERLFNRREQTFSYYASVFSPLANLLSESKSNGQNLITGDFSIHNIDGPFLWHCLGRNVGHGEPVEGNPEYIYHLNKDARIIFNIRNPVDRLWSEYLHFSAEKNKSAKSFDQLVTNSVRVYRDCMRVRTLRSCLYDKPLAQISLEHKDFQRSHHGCFIEPDAKFFLHRGVYQVFIKDYLKVFPRQQVLIQRIEDFSEDMEKAVTRMYTFLDLRILPKDEMKNIIDFEIDNVRIPINKKKGDMLESTRQMLYEFYKPHNEQLAILLNDVKYNYGPRDG